ncbi:MAG: helix-turn-helix domain-containing protein [Peptococcaceae bacterium]|nr:helix-turn-helix domain-containing protein [Peptococcaceae bacterium]
MRGESMTIGAKIRSLREHYRLTLKELAKRAGISLSYLADIEKGRSNPSVDTLTGIARVLGKPAGYFLDEKVDILAVLESEPGFFVAAGKPLSAEQRQGLRQILIGQAMDAPRQVPFIGRIGPDTPVLARENIAGYLDLPPGARADFVLEVKDDGMKYGGINEGDRAICRETATAADGQVVAVLLNENGSRATLRFYFERGGRGFLRAANPAYREVEMGPGDRILGLVVEILKRPPAMNQYLELLNLSGAHLARWNEVINFALAAGVEPERVKTMIEMQVEIARKVFEDGGKYRY